MVTHHGERHEVVDTAHPQEEAAIRRARRVLDTPGIDPADVAQSASDERDMVAIALGVTSMYALITTGVWQARPNALTAFAMACTAGAGLACAGLLTATVARAHRYRRRHQP